MLRVSDLCKSYGTEPVLRDVSFTLAMGERVGLVGPNGSGKSTLLEILAGRLRADRGSVWIDPHDTVGYLPQAADDDLNLSIEQVLVRGAGPVGALRARLVALERAIVGDGGRIDGLLDEYAEVQSAFEQAGGYALQSRIHSVLGGLRLEADLSTPVASLSGGARTKLLLARLLLSGASILLLDEPTNFLDLPALLWLESYLRAVRSAAIIVSHDRRFLDRTVSGILEVVPGEGTVHSWAGTYSDYAAARQREADKRLQRYHDQQHEIQRLREDIRRTKEQARTVERHVHSGMGADSQRRIAKKVARKATSRERRLERRLETELTEEKPVAGWNLHLPDMGREPITDDRLVCEATGLNAGYGDREVLRGLSLLVRGRDRVAVLGENGSGKSTLVRCIAGTMPHTGQVRLGPSIRIGVLSQERDHLAPDRSPLDILRSQVAWSESDARSYLHRFLFAGPEALKPVRSLSHGQRAKLALALLVVSDANFLVLDEPTGHLDMPAIETVEAALSGYAGPLLVVSHDRAFIDAVGVTRVEVMRAGRLDAFPDLDAYEAWVRSAA